MNDSKSDLIYKVLHSINQVETSKVSMWSPTDKYARPPFLRFRFKGVATDSSIYHTLAEIIGNFKNGYLDWIQFENLEISANRIIIPTLFLNGLENPFQSHERFFRDLIGRQQYETNIEKAIMDVPKLADHISNEWQKKNDNNG